MSEGYTDCLHYSRSVYVHRFMSKYGVCFRKIDYLVTLNRMAIFRKHNKTCKSLS